MEDKNFQFKTNLNCTSCVAKVESELNNTDGISEWSVDVANSNKTLTVKAEGISEEEVINIIKKKGFHAESLSIKASI